MQQVVERSINKLGPDELHRRRENRGVLKKPSAQATMEEEEPISVAPTKRRETAANTRGIWCGAP